MTRFFLTFLIIFFSCAVNAGSNSWSESDEFRESVRRFITHMETLSQQAQKKQQEKTPLTEGDNNVLTPLYLMQTDASPLSGTRGYSPWQETPFGQIRLVSCYSGISPNDPTIFTAVQLVTKDGWHIKKPTIILTTPDMVNTFIGIPLIYPLTNGLTKTNYYVGDYFFPIITSTKSFQKEVHLAVDFAYTACYLGTCQNGVIPLTLLLTDKDHFPTGICPYMTRALNQIPVNPKEKAHVKAIQNDSGDIQFIFDFDQKIKVLSIQIDNDWTFNETSKTIKGKQATLTIHPTTLVPSDELIQLKVISSAGYYDMPVQLTRGHFVQMDVHFPWGDALWGGLYLLLGTPFFAYYLLFKPRSKQALSEAVKQTILVNLIIGFIFGLLWFAGIIHPMDLLQQIPALGFLIFPVLLYLLWKPSHGLLATWLIFWVIPKPYLFSVFESAEPGTFTVLFLGVFWGWFISIPAIIMYRGIDGAYSLYKVFNSASKPLTNMARLPLFVLMGWLLIGGLGNYYVNRSIPIYDAAHVTQNLLHGKTVFVSIENQICFSCAWNKAISLRTGFARRPYQNKNLLIYRLPFDSAAGKNIQLRYGKKYAPINVLYGPGNLNGLILPDYVPYTDLQHFLQAVLAVD